VGSNKSFSLDASTHRCSFRGFVGNAKEVDDAGTDNAFDLTLTSAATAALFTFGVGDVVRIRSNSGKIPNSGVAHVGDGGTIAHLAGLLPNVVHVNGTIATEYVTPTGMNATNITVAIKKRSDGSAGTAQDVYWSVEYSP
jgi:hypothetical protein